MILFYFKFNLKFLNSANYSIHTLIIAYKFTLTTYKLIDCYYKNKSTLLARYIVNLKYLSLRYLSSSNHAN